MSRHRSRHVVIYATLPLRERLHSGSLHRRFRGPSLARPRVVVECWIGIVEEDGRRIVRLAGRLAEAQVPELLMACEEPGGLTLDLTDLVSADVAGLDSLRRVQARGVSLVGVPGYIKMKLDSCFGGREAGPKR